ncbi:MAG: serine/threonine-protein kinase [Rhodanobacteraceae bacterium]
MDATDPQSWSEIERLLDAALDLPDRERESWVRLHASRAEIAAFVLDVLARDHRIGDFLEGPAPIVDVAAAADRFAAGLEATLSPGREIGAWRLLRELGSGGMAVVWLAERSADAGAETAALKLVRPGLDSTLLRERFARERRILALLQHPRIARLLDGGVADGRQYLALEFVDGEAITEWCARHRASTRSRLELVLQICDAVAFAHARLIIHRDLKPSNILVDAHGNVHLLDFGIAKILSGETPEPTALTAIGGRAMTTAYASPEQIEGLPLGVATDVYTLAVVLHELLTGQLPYRVPRTNLAAIEDAILHDEPRPASAALDASFASQRHVALRRARQELRGDVDRILAKALEKQPLRRYATIDAFADDLRRHLRGQPIRAQRASLRYRASKFVRRHAFGLAVTTALAAAVVAGIAGTLWQAHRASESAHAAREEAAAAGAVRDLLLDMFRTADPDVSRGRDPSASELLDTATRRLEAGLHDQPVLKARLLGVVADLHRKLGNYARATELFGEAAEVPAMAESAYVEERSRLRTGRATSLMVAGDLDAAGAELDRIERELDAAGTQSERAPARLRARLERGELLRRQGRYDEARAALDEALAAFATKTDDLDGRETALRYSADLEFSRGHLDDARRGFTDLLARLQDRYGEDHTEVARAYNDRAVVLAQLGRVEEAEHDMRRALELRVHLLGREHPAVADSHWNLGATLRRLNRLDEAEAQYRESLAIFRDTLGDDTVEVARVYNGLGALAGARRDHAASEQFLRDALRRYEKALGATHPDVGMTLNNLAVAQRRLGRIDESAANARRALAIQEATLPAGHFLIAVTRFTLGSLALMQGDAAAAVTWLEPAARTMEASMGAAHPDVVRAKLQWAVALSQTGNVAQAEEIAGSVTVPAGDRRIEADATYLSGRVHLAAGKLSDACQNLDRSWALRKDLEGGEDSSTLEAELYLGECLLRSADDTGSAHVRHAARKLLALTQSSPALKGDAARLEKRVSGHGTRRSD